jgi:hypothetical protein
VGVVGPALDDAVDAFRRAEVGDAEAGDAGLGGEAVDLLVEGHEGEEIVDALFGGEGGVFVGGGSLGECGEGDEAKKSDSGEGGAYWAHSWGFSCEIVGCL